MMIKLTNVSKFHFYEVENASDIIPTYRGLYIWYMRDVYQGIIYIGESQGVKGVSGRLAEEVRYFNNGAWNCYNPQTGESFPAFLAAHLDDKSVDHVLKEGKIYIPDQKQFQNQSHETFERVWRPYLDFHKKRIEILTIENPGDIDNKKIEAYLIDKVFTKYKETTGKKLSVKGAKDNQTQIGHIQGGKRFTWPDSVEIDFNNLEIKPDIRELLS